MDVIFWYNTILWDGSWILDQLVSDRGDCDFDESSVLDDDTEKKAVKNTESLLEFLCVFKMQLCDAF